MELIHSVYAVHWRRIFLLFPWKRFIMVHVVSINHQKLHVGWVEMVFVVEEGIVYALHGDPWKVPGDHLFSKLDVSSWVK